MIWLTIHKLMDLDYKINMTKDEETKLTINKMILDEMRDTYINKNSDYGDSFDKTIDEFGLVAPAIRMSDKLNRFKKLIKAQQNVKDESIEDTLLDLANYAVLTLMHIRNEECPISLHENYKNKMKDK